MSSADCSDGVGKNRLLDTLVEPAKRLAKKRKLVPSFQRSAEAVGAVRGTPQPRP